MIKSFRRQFWFFQAFFKKYAKQVIGGFIATILIFFTLNFLISKIPQSKPHIRVGIIGQFTSSQLPPIITNFLNAGLTSQNASLETVPNLAASWSTENNDLTYVFEVRPDLVWSTGKPVKLTDIKINLPNIKTEIIEPNIIKFNLPAKFSPFPSLLNFPLVNQQGKVIGGYDIKIRQKTSGVISQITLESSTHRITFTPYSTAKQAITAFKLGNLDIVSGIPSSENTSLDKFGKIQEYTSSNQVVLLIFNQTDPNLKDKNIRQGIAYALKDKTFGYEPALTTINPRSWAYNMLVKTYSYNIDRAKELIKTPISLELSTLPELLPIAEQIKNSFDPNLINLNVKVVTGTPDSYQLFLTNYSIPNDPDQYRDWHSTQSTNLSKGSDEKIDKLLEDGRTTIDMKERKKIYFDFQKSFAEELPALTLYQPKYINLARKETLFVLLDQGK